MHTACFLWKKAKLAKLEIHLPTWYVFSKNSQASHVPIVGNMLITIVWYWFVIYLAFVNLLVWFSSPISAFRNFKYVRRRWQFGIEIVVCSAFITPKSLLECNTPVNCHFLWVIFLILWKIRLYWNKWRDPLQVSSPPTQGSLLSNLVQERGNNKYGQVQSSWG